METVPVPSKLTHDLTAYIGADPEAFKASTILADAIFPVSCVEAMLLFVKVCTSLVPTKSPEGFVFVVKEEDPFPINTPVSDDAPVPPFATGKVPATEGKDRYR